MDYIAYTDGSFKSVPGVGDLFSGAALLMCESRGVSTTLTKCSDEMQLLKMRNVAGEMIAVMMVVEHCVNVLHLTKSDRLIVYHDYIGLANGTKRPGEKDFWRAKNDWTRAYRDYVLDVMQNKFPIMFEHVRGHSGIKANEYVDQLAKQAIDTEILNRVGAKGVQS